MTIQRGKWLESYMPGRVWFDEIDSTDHPMHGSQCGLCGMTQTIGKVVITLRFTGYTIGQQICYACLMAMAQEVPLPEVEKRFEKIKTDSPLRDWITTSPSSME